MIVHISSADDIRHLERIAVWLDRPAVDAVAIDLPGLSVRDADLAAVRIGKYFNDCGCGWALAAFLLGLPLLLITPAIPVDHGPLRVAAAILVAAFAAALAKMAALLWSYWRLRRLLARFSSFVGGSHGTHMHQDR